MYQILRTTAVRVLKTPRDQFLLAGTLAYLLALEAIGRHPDLPRVAVDLFLVAALAVGGVWLTLAHVRQRVAWIAWGTRRIRRVRRRLRGSTYRVGWDLRREPPVPRRLPPALLSLVSVCGLLTLGALLWNVWQPMSARQLVGQISSVLFAAGQFVLWCALLMLIVGILLAGPALLRDLVVFRQAGTRWGRIHRGWYFALFLMVCVAGISLLPPSIATLILAGTFLVGGVSVWLPPRREFDFIWQPRDRAVVYSMSWRTYVSLMNSVTILVCLLLLLLAVGPEALGLQVRTGETASVSRALGILASWVAATGAVVFLWPMTLLELTTRRHDPAVPAPTHVQVSGEVTGAEQRQIRDVLAPRGWTAGFGSSKKSATDVRVQIRRDEDATDANPRWPRLVLPDEFGDEEFQWLIARRDQIQRRRIFLRTLESILKQARKRRYEKSGGFWIAPHYWFVLGLTRDTGERGQDEEPAPLLDIIPPLYHKAFPRPVRQHFHEVCRALEIDLVYLEDGVQWRGLRRVMRLMFEHFDIHGGAGRIEELHFTGVPRVRVIIHEFELGSDWERGQYPEPDYDDLARARVLHVFRDRGEEEVPRETPMDWDHLPSPVPAGSSSM